MDIETIREYCLAKPYTCEDFPFGEDIMLFKVGTLTSATDPLKTCPGKMFVLVSLNPSDYMALKCDPERAIELRERYPDEIEGAYHMNKKHWNGINLQGGRLTDGQLREMIDDSYELMVRSLPKWVRDQMSAK